MLARGDGSVSDGVVVLDDDESIVTHAPTYPRTDIALKRTIPTTEHFPYQDPCPKDLALQEPPRLSTLYIEVKTGGARFRHQPIMGSNP